MRRKNQKLGYYNKDFSLIFPGQNMNSRFIEKYNLFSSFLFHAVTHFFCINGVAGRLFPDRLNSTRSAFYGIVRAAPDG